MKAGKYEALQTRRPPSKKTIPALHRLSNYQYVLPQELIAQEPLPGRDNSRLMVVCRTTGEIRHHTFKDLPALLSPSDLLVLNETRVLPACLMCTKGSGGRVELLVLDPAGVGSACKPEGPAARVCLVRSSKPLRAGTEVQVISGPRLKVEDRVAPGRVRIRFPVEEREFQGWLDRFGLPPLPPYIKPESRDAERDRLAYQTVYAKTPGSVAAPTAGLHFTEELLREIERRGIETARILLHVGPGTFTPVRHEDIRLHRMESEFYDITESEADRISRASQENRRIIAIGTTSVRALESAATAEGKLANSQGSTSLFITPGYDFKLVKGMVTNFHLPGSTLLMLVCAFAGTDLIRKAYEEAMRRKYRFYSYGDACLLFD